MTDHLDALERGCCPDCGSTSLWDGPRGGLSVNQQCLMCGSWWNVLRYDFGDEVGRHVILAERIPDKPGFNPYFDAACPPRRCDHCGRFYKGPAVYCSLGCAQADA